MARKKSSKGKKKTQAPPQAEKTKATVKESVEEKRPVKLPNPVEVEFESMLDVGRSGHVNRANYDDSNLHKFILQNNLHGKVIRVVADTSMTPVNGNLITKYTIYRKD